MGMQLNTGDTGNAVTAEADGSLYSKIFGSGCYVLQGGNELKAEVQSNNKIKIYDGDIIMQGRHAYIPASDSDIVTIENGSSDMNRIDLIVAKYKKESNGMESIGLYVIKGTPTSGTPVAPDYVDGDILLGATEKDFPLYEVTLTGINITSVEKKFVLLGNISELTNNLPQVSGSLSDWLFFKYPNGYIEAHRFHQFTGIACSTSSGGEYVSGNLWFGNPPAFDGATWTGGYGNAGFGSMSAGSRFHRVYSLNDNGAVRVIIACRASSPSVSFPAHVVLTGTWK